MGAQASRLLRVEGLPQHPTCGERAGCFISAQAAQPGLLPGVWGGLLRQRKADKCGLVSHPLASRSGHRGSVGTQKTVPGLLEGAGLTTAPEIICWKPIEGATLGPLPCTPKSTRVCKDTRAGGSLATQLEPAWWRHGETEAHLGDLLCVASADVREGRADGKVRMSPHV